MQVGPPVWNGRVGWRGSSGGQRIDGNVGRSIGCGHAQDGQHDDERGDELTDDADGKPWCGLAVVGHGGASLCSAHLPHVAREMGVLIVRSNRKKGSPLVCGNPFRGRV